MSATSMLPLITMQLQHVMGHTSNHQAAHTISPLTQDLAYITGNCVSFLPRDKNVAPYSALQGRAGHQLSACSYSPHRSLLAVGELGAAPEVRVYELLSSLPSATPRLLCRAPPKLFEEHITVIKWHPTLPGVLFVTGYTHATIECDAPSSSANASDDARVLQPTLSVLEVHEGTARVLHSRTIPGLQSFDIAHDGSYWAACAANSITIHTIQWQLATATSELRILDVHTAAAKLNVTKAVYNNFGCVICGVAICHAYIFALTREGVLCALTKKERRKSSSSGSTKQQPSSWEIEKWVDLRLDLGYSLSFSCLDTRGIIAIAGAEGKIRLFEPLTLTHIATLPKAPAVHHVNTISVVPLASASTSPTTLSSPSSTLGSSIPHTLALSLLPDQSQAIAFYSDRSIVSWNIRDLEERQVTPYYTLHAHSGCIWSMISIAHGTSQLPMHSILSCAADSTLSLWHLDVGTALSACQAREPRSNYKAQTRHLERQFARFHFHEDGGAKHLASLAPTRSDLVVALDRKGTLRNISLINGSTLNTLLPTAAADVRCMAYNDDSKLLVMGTRDATLLVASFDDLEHPVWLPHFLSSCGSGHNTAILSLKLAAQGTLLVSLSAESVCVHEIERNGGGESIAVMRHQHPFKDALALEVHPSQRFVAVSSADCTLRVLDLLTHKETRAYRTPSACLQLCLDASGSLLAIATEDRAVLLLDWFSGAPLCQLQGHAALITSLLFVTALDGCTLLSSSSDGCLLAHRLDPRCATALLSSTPRTHRRAPSDSAPPALTARKTRRRASDYLAEREPEPEKRGTDLTPMEEEQKSAPSEALSSAAPIVEVFRAPLVPPLQLSSSILAHEAGGDNSLPLWARTRTSAGLTRDEPSLESESSAQPPQPPTQQHSRWASRAYSAFALIDSPSPAADGAIDESSVSSTSTSPSASPVLSHSIVEPLRTASLIEDERGQADTESHEIERRAETQPSLPAIELEPQPQCDGTLVLDLETHGGADGGMPGPEIDAVLTALPIDTKDIAQPKIEVELTSAGTEVELQEIIASDPLEPNSEQVLHAASSWLASSSQAAAFDEVELRDAMSLMHEQCSRALDLYKQSLANSIHTAAASVCRSELAELRNRLNEALEWEPAGLGATSDNTRASQSLRHGERSMEAMMLDASFGSTGQVLQGLDRYSDLLVSLVKKKLEETMR